MDEALITVIVPVYNAEAYLHTCVDSLLRQTHRNLEIILVDDGATDRSGEICDAYAQQDARVKVIHQENGGQATAKNLALGMARGRYIGFADSDDFLEPEMYACLLEAIGDHDIAMCGRYNVEEDSGERSTLFCADEPFVMERNEAIRRFLTYDHIDSAGCDKLFKKEVLEGLSFPVGYICEDIPFVYRALKRCDAVVHTGKPLYHYLQRSGSTSHSGFSKKTEGLVKYAAEVARDVCATMPELKEEADYFYHVNFFTYAQKYGNSASAEKGKLPLTFSDVFYKGYTGREKCKLLLLKLHLYGFVRRLRWWSLGGNR